MQQMNHVLARRAQDGFCVERFDCGVNQRPIPPPADARTPSGGPAAAAAGAQAGPEGGAGSGAGSGTAAAAAGAPEGIGWGAAAAPSGVQHNLYFNILLKKVVPLLPLRRVAAPPAHAQTVGQGQGQLVQGAGGAGAGSGGAGAAAAGSAQGGPPPVQQ